MKIWHFLMAVAMLLMACDDNMQQKDQQADTPAEGDWHVGVMPTLDCLPLMVAKERGLFKEAGVGVWIDCYDAQMDVDTALERGRVVAAVTDLVRMEHLKQRGVRLTCAGHTDGQWQLIAKRTARMTKLAQLDDKMLAMTRYSATDLLADLAVDSAKLKSERVFRIQMNDIGVRLGMLQSDIMDAMLLPEPQATEARNMKGTVLLDTRKLDMRLGCITFMEDSLKGKEKQLKAFLTAYDQAVDSLNERGIGCYADVVRRYFEGVAESTWDSIGHHAEFTHTAPPRKKDMERVEKWWKKRLDSMKYVEKRYIQ